MDSSKSAFKHLRNPIWVGVTLLSITVVIVIVASRLLYTHTVNLITENLRQRILSISITAAAGIDASDLSALKVQDDWTKPEWTRVVSHLNKSKYSNKDVVFMYIFRKKSDDPNSMEFVADADSINPYANTNGDPTHYVDVNRDGLIEPDGPDKLQWPGQPYPEAVDIPETFEAYDGPLTSKDLYTDDYGTVLTGYAPITDQFGNTVAVLATDIKADDFFTITRETLLPFLGFIVFLTLIISILTIIIIYTWKKYAVSLEKLNQNIEDANNKLTELDKMKSEFLSLASHQIRSPLTAIKGYSSMLLDGDYGELPEKAHEAVGTVMTSSQNLIDIVGDFLDISRIEQGRMVYNKEKFDLIALVRETGTSLEPNIEKAGLTLKIDIPENFHATIDADKGKIKQVIGNMIDNALKYTLKGSVTITAKNKKSKGDTRVRIAITDTGIGIDPSEMPKLFAKFSRTKDAHKQNVSGTGLGLYIAKRMIEAHGGVIDVSSPGLGKGSTFAIELPVVPN